MDFLLVVIATPLESGMFGAFPNTFQGKMSQHQFPYQYSIFSPHVFLLKPDEGLESTWLMDSSCLPHMTGGSKWFFSFDRLIG
jgi:hypothetical protein